MDLRDHLLQTKRFFEEQEKKYIGPDPLSIRCQFISFLERYEKSQIQEIYCPFLEDTLKQFKDNPTYKQDLRFIQLWLNYSSTQDNPVEVMERMHSRGLGTECAVLYSSWAGLLVKQGLLTKADSIFKMGLNHDAKPKSELEKEYDEFLKDIGRKLLLGKISCPKCGSCYNKSTGSKDSREAERAPSDVEVWEWNPLRVGEPDDFKCPLAYFEDPDPTKIRMYPKDKVYPGNGEEFSLEEIFAAEYELKYREEEAKQKALAEAKNREEEARRARQEQNELRKMEAEKFNTITEMNPPVQATIPVVTPQMLNIKPMDNSLANSTTFTVHTKEAMNVVQDMWSSPGPSDVPRKTVEVPTQPPKPMKFEIYSEDNVVQQTPKEPFQIYDENVDRRPKTNPPSRVKLPFDIYDENAPPNVQPVKKIAFDIYDEKPPNSQAINKQLPFDIYDENAANNQPVNKHKTSEEHAMADLSEKMEAQARLQPFFNVQDKNDDFSDVTCNTKAFEFVLPSSTPLALHKKPFMSAQKFETPVTENTRLSVILESSKDKSTNSSASSIVSAGVKTPKAGPVIQTITEGFDPFSSSLIEELLSKIGFPKENHLSNYHVKTTNLPTGSKSLKLGDEVYSILGEIGKGAYAKVVKANVRSSTVALKIEKPPCKWEYYIAKEIQSRVPPKFASSYMDISAAYIYNNGSILETQYAKYGTLVNNINLFKEKIGKSLDLGVVLHYCIELVDIVEYLHKSKIIHADLKPDNIVIRELPAHNEAEPCLQLIDFGRCIDMSLLPPDTEFNHVFKTEDNKCIEMKENRPWTYQIDLQGLASIFYCLLLSDYMKVIKKNDRWTLQKTLSRNMKREVWNPIFDSLLNVSPSDLPFNFAPMRQSLVETFEGSLNNYLQHIVMFRNTISGK